jgi:uncharacterized membrane protein
MGEIFANHAHFVVFVHIFGAIVWIGGMIAVRVAVHPVVATIEDRESRVDKSLRITAGLFGLVMPFIALIALSALFMATAQWSASGEIRRLLLAKTVIFALMCLNYLYMYIRRESSWRLLKEGRVEDAARKAALLPERLIPLNIFLGLCALYIGVTLRGF